MRSFAEIYDIAVRRHGGEAAVEARLTRPLPAAGLSVIADDRWLAGMTRAIFQAGFNWKVIENKWPGFEEAFGGFDIAECANRLPDSFDALTHDKRIVRNPAKIAAVQANAQFIDEIAREHGGFGRWIVSWPRADYVELLAELGRRGARLGGATAQYFLRSMGADGFIFSKDVVTRLMAEGVLDRPPTSRKAQLAAQAAFDRWADESGRSLTEISRVLALSI
ncbi:MAG: 3-methyladenine DNA glycosylase [Sphingomonadales bacterium BRH_c42]|nr:MAG: 3-methyladenine DNA glycosylase [Sphingomonadales bacterium BRH_c42]